MNNRKIAIGLLTAMTFLLCSCGTNGETEKVQNASDVDSNIELITDWDEMAEITLGDAITIKGNGASEKDSVISITEGGAYRFSGSAKQVMVKVDTKENVKIILDEVEMTNTSGPVIYGENSASIYVETAEDTTNTLTDGASYEQEGKAVIFSNDDLVFLGNGVLEINGNYKHGICSDDEIYFEGGNYHIAVTAKDGVHANDRICVDDGTFSISAVSDLMESEGELLICGGSITGTSEDEGLESKSDFLIKGGMIDLNVVDDGLNASGSIVIDDGEIRILASTGDAIDSNGSLTVNGGTIYAYGGSAPEGALDCDMEEVTINGGTVVAVGDENSSISDESQQVSVLLAGYEKGSQIVITDDQEQEVISFTLEESRNNIVLSCEGFEEGETYQVMVNDVSEQSFTVEGTVVEAGGTAGMMGGGAMMEPGNRNDMNMDGMVNNRGQGMPAMDEMGGQPPELPTEGGGNGMQPPQEQKTN